MVRLEQLVEDCVRRNVTEMSRNIRNSFLMKSELGENVLQDLALLGIVAEAHWGIAGLRVHVLRRTLNGDILQVYRYHGVVSRNANLDEINCPEAGVAGHYNCGWCPRCDTDLNRCVCPRSSLGERSRSLRRVEINQRKGRLYGLTREPMTFTLPAPNYTMPNGVPLAMCI